MERFNSARTSQRKVRVNYKYTLREATGVAEAATERECVRVIFDSMDTFPLASMEWVFGDQVGSITME